MGKFAVVTVNLMSVTLTFYQKAHICRKDCCVFLIFDDRTDKLQLNDLRRSDPDFDPPDLIRDDNCAERMITYD